MNFSKRSAWELKTNALMTLVSELKAQNKPILDLTVSNPTQCQLDFPQEAILRALDHPQNLNYKPVAAGKIEAREAIAQYYKVSAENIVLTSSTSEAYTHLFLFRSCISQLGLCSTSRIFRKKTSCFDWAWALYNSKPFVCKFFEY